MNSTEHQPGREYSHPAVGKTVVRKSGETDIIQKVIDSGFGKIAVLSSIAPKGLLLSQCRIIETS